jgi:hypothetical protein
MMEFLRYCWAATKVVIEIYNFMGIDSARHQPHSYPAVNQPFNEVKTAQGLISTGQGGLL